MSGAHTNRRAFLLVCVILSLLAGERALDGLKSGWTRAEPPVLPPDLLTLLNRVAPADEPVTVIAHRGVRGDRFWQRASIQLYPRTTVRVAPEDVMSVTSGFGVSATESLSELEPPVHAVKAEFGENAVLLLSFDGPALAPALPTGVNANVTTAEHDRGVSIVRTRSADQFLPLNASPFDPLRTMVAIVLLAFNGGVLIALVGREGATLGWGERIGFGWVAGCAWLAWWVQLAIAVTGRAAPIWWWLSLMPSIVWLMVSVVRRGRFSVKEVMRTRGMLARVALTIAVVAALFAAVAFVRLAPRGDGIGVWAIKATALKLDALGSIPYTHYLQAGSLEFTHRGYPLGLPATQVWLQLVTGGGGDHLLILPGIVSLVAILLVVGGYVTRKAGWITSTVVLGVLITSPLLLNHATSGYADVPMAAAVACVMVAVGELVERQRTADVYLFALMVAAALLIKREGVVTLVACLFVLAFLACVKRFGFRKAWVSTGVVFVAVTVAVLPWRLLMLRVEVPSRDFLPVVELPGHLDRIPALVEHASFLFLFHPESGWIWIVMASATILFRHRFRLSEVLAAGLVLGVMLGASTLLFALSDFEVFLRHAYYAMDRLFLHAAPVAAILAGLLMVPAGHPGLSRERARAIETRRT